MSRRPGVGFNWANRFMSDAFPSDFVICRGVKMKPPRYYLEMYGEADERGRKRVRAVRIAHALEHAADSTPDRLRVREQVKEAAAARLARSLEEEG